MMLQQQRMRHSAAAASRRTPSAAAAAAAGGGNGDASLLFVSRGRSRARCRAASSSGGGGGPAPRSPSPQQHHQHQHHQRRGQQQQQPPSAALSSAPTTSTSPSPTSARPQGLPDVDWSRLNLQVLFVDQHDQLRARLAAGLFEKTAAWNGHDRSLQAWTAGVAVDGTVTPEKQLASMSARASIISQAALLGLPPKPFARPSELFEARDLDAYDVVVAVDAATRKQMLDQADPAFRRYYSDRVRLLSDYAQQAPLPDAAVLAKGGLALLPRAMSASLSTDLAALRAVADVPRPELASAGVAEWNSMVLVTMLGCAGLVQYLISQCPPDDGLHE